MIVSEIKNTTKSISLYPISILKEMNLTEEIQVIISMNMLNHFFRKGFLIQAALLVMFQFSVASFSHELLVGVSKSGFHFIQSLPCSVDTLFRSYNILRSRWDSYL